MDLQPLWDEAFLVSDATRANEALDEARHSFPPSPEGRAFSYEVVLPEDLDVKWFEEQLVAHLVYHCESTRAPLPECDGVFVSMFFGQTLYCVAASKVVAFAGGLLQLDHEAMVERFGTGEVRHALKTPAETVALPGPPDDSE